MHAAQPEMKVPDYIHSIDDISGYVCVHTHKHRVCVCVCVCVFILNKILRPEMSVTLIS